MLHGRASDQRRLLADTDLPEGEPPMTSDPTCAECGTPSVRGRYGYLTGRCQKHEDELAERRARSRRRPLSPTNEAQLREDDWHQLSIGGHYR